ncbi:ABC transporter substrate-binding protein [Planifilum fimeticola]
MRKIWVVLLVVAMLMWTGCSGSPSREADSEGEGGKPRQGGTIRIALQSDGKTLDPHKATDAASMHLIENMYSRLMRYTEKYGEVEGELAEKVEVSKDGKTYTFTLRKGVRFHGTGRELTSEDVKYSIERIIDLGVRKDHFSAVDEIETPDSHTVVFRLKQPMAPFLTYLAYPMNAIVDRETVENHDGSLDRADAGSGPFQLDEWKKDQYLRLKKFPGYYLPEKPYLDKVVFRPIPDETARMTALRNREVDMILDVSAKEARMLEQVSSVEVVSVPGTFWEYIGLNTKRPPLDDVKVRQAIAHAVDREAINKIAKLNRATVLKGGNIPPNHWAHADFTLYPRRNVAKAKQLLEEAGKENLELTLKVGSDFPYQVDAAQIVKQQLKEVGIDVKVSAQESGLFFDALGKGDFDMAIVGWLGFVDPDEFTYNLFHTGAPWNQQGYSNEQVDALLEKGRTVGDQEERKKIYHRAQKIIAEEAPMVFLYVNERTAAMSKAVKGFDVHPTVTTLSLEETWLAR